MPTIAYQLYCSRNFGPPEATMKMLADAGYRFVEGFGGLYGDPDRLAAALAENGLAMPSGHFGLDMVESDPDGAIRVARQLGVQKVFVPWVAPEHRGTDLASWKAFANRVATALKPVKDAGLVTGWHNHDWDLADVGGTTPVDLMADAGLDLELDLGWTTRSGNDPVATLRRLEGKVKAVHIKDIAPAGTTAEDGWADVGHGTQDWPAIVAELRRQGIDHWVIEHDNPADDARFARNSLSAAQSW